MRKRIIRGAIRLLAGFAAVVFLLAPMTTGTGLILFVSSILLLLACLGLLKLLKDDRGNTGYGSTNPQE